MEIKRFFVTPDKLTPASVIIDGDEFYHITKVLRLKKGYKIVVCTGDGNDYFAVIDGVFDNRITAVIEKISPNETNLPFKLVMLQAVPAKDKLEFIVQKAAELGVSRFVPFFSSRVNERSINIPRLEKIAKEAAKQCGANTLMRVDGAVSFEQAVKIAVASSVAVLAYEEQEREDESKTLLAMRDRFKANDDGFSAAFIIGPEGGFDKSEAEYMRENGIEPVTLGRRILRCETAGIAAAAIITALYDGENKIK